MQMVNHPNRAKRLKVFGGCFDGTTRTIIAAPNQQTARAAFGVSSHAMVNYCSETWNEHEVSVAMSKPGVVFSGPNSTHTDEFVEGNLRYNPRRPWPPAKPLTP